MKNEALVHLAKAQNMVVLTTPSERVEIPEDALMGHGSWLSQAVVVFDDAKPLLRALQKMGITIRAPLCLSTLEKITDSAPLQQAPQGAAIFDRVVTLLDAVSAHNCEGLARLECEVLPAFASIEVRGLYVDAPKWEKAIADQRALAQEAARRCEALLGPLVEKDLFGAAVVNLNHPEEMRLLLEKALQKSIPSTTHEQLSELKHPLADALLAYREATKLVSTYGDAFLAYLDPHTRRIHAEFITLGTSSGRTSCVRPNLQNLPSCEAFQACLVAPAGRALIHADFGACELRVLAGLANDANFLAALNSDDDFHSVVASQLFETKVSKTERPELRDRAKAVNFGIIYGMGAKGLARSLQISEDEANAILTRYFSRFSGIKAFLENCVNEARDKGYVKTLHGRRLSFASSADLERDIARIAKNMPIQGSAAELAKVAMTRVHNRLGADFKDAFLVNMIHDELVVECDFEDRNTVGEAVKFEMMEAQRALFQKVRPEVDLQFVL